MNQYPLISIIIPTYKGEELICNTIDKVLNQTYSNLEIIIVDDNGKGSLSQINTEKLILANYPYIKYHALDSNSGVTVARNVGGELAKGTYLNFLDQDDDLLPEKIFRQWEIFSKADNSLGLVYCSRIEKYVDSGREQVVVAKFNGDVSKILGLNHIGPPTVALMKTEAFKKVEGFNTKFKFRSEIELYFRIAKLYSFDYVAEPLVVYNRRTGTFSSNKAMELNEMILFVEEYGNQFNKNVTAQVYERLGELYAVNGQMLPAWGAFLKAFGANPMRVKVLVKALLTVGGMDFYKKMRKIN
ncbi:MAG: glycosyltransferase family 2 protein [Flavobacterium sp.]